MSPGCFPGAIDAEIERGCHCASKLLRRRIWSIFRRRSDTQIADHKLTYDCQDPDSRQSIQSEIAVAGKSLGYADLFRAILELAGRFSPLVRRFEDFGGILKVKPL